MAGAPKRILFIEDEPDIQKTVSLRLRANGYDVTVASDGQEGLKKAKELKPDLVLTDLLLPKLDGWRVCQQLKNDPDCQRIPVIMFSGSVGDDTQPVGVEIGDAYIPKPFDPEKLLGTIKRLLEQREAP